MGQLAFELTNRRFAIHTKTGTNVEISDMTTTTTKKNTRCTARCIFFTISALMLTLLIGFLYFIYQAIDLSAGFQPPEMMAAQYPSQTVVGDLGGMKVRIPRYCAEYVEYDSDPSWGEKRPKTRPVRTSDSRLRSFGIDFHLATMTCKENKAAREDWERNFLNKESQWVGISINAGEDYPSLGADANNGVAKFLWQKSEDWHNNFQRAPNADVAELQAYVVEGVNPKTGRPADEDIYIHKPHDTIEVFISCTNTSVPGGVETCRMRFGLEPIAKVYVKVGFKRYQLNNWREIKEKSTSLLLGFELSDAPETTSKSKLN